MAEIAKILSRIEVEGVPPQTVHQYIVQWTATTMVQRGGTLFAAKVLNGAIATVLEHGPSVELEVARANAETPPS